MLNPLDDPLTEHTSDGADRHWAAYPDNGCATTALVANQYPDDHERHDMSATIAILPDTPARPIGVSPQSGVADMSAARQLFGTGTGSADVLGLAPIAIQRWESEGGALPAGYDGRPPVL